MLFGRLRFVVFVVRLFWGLLYCVDFLVRVTRFALGLDVVGTFVLVLV